MKKTVKITTIVLVSILALGALGYGGLYLLVRTIHNQRSCVLYNIDNIEVHTGIDIPKIESFDCEYSKEQNTKMTRFDIDKAAVNIDRYIERNEFQKLEAKTDVEFEQFLKIDNSLADASTSADLYYTKGSYKEETW